MLPYLDTTSLSEKKKTTLGILHFLFKKNRFKSSSSKDAEDKKALSKRKLDSHPLSFENPDTYY